MPREALEQFLRTADATAPAPPALAADLPSRVRHRHYRRRRIKSVAAAAVAIIALPLLAMTVFTRHSSPPPPTIATKPPPTLTRADLARLDLQAELHAQTAAELLHATTSPADIQPGPADDPTAVLAHVRQQRDRAALILIYEAEQAARDKQTHRAAATYRRTIELFPKTYAAAVARERLKEIPT